MYMYSPLHTYIRTYTQTCIVISVPACDSWYNTPVHDWGLCRPHIHGCSLITAPKLGARMKISRIPIHCPIWTFLIATLIIAIVLLVLLYYTEMYVHIHVLVYVYTVHVQKKGGGGREGERERGREGNRERGREREREREGRREGGRERERKRKDKTGSK